MLYAYITSAANFKGTPEHFHNGSNTIYSFLTLIQPMHFCPENVSLVIILLLHIFKGKKENFYHESKHYEPRSTALKEEVCYGSIMFAI